ncbi:hypothetical protein VTI28DRAFT_2311 [Corynascus sepedonium]
MAAPFLVKRPRCRVMVTVWKWTVGPRQLDRQVEDPPALQDILAIPRWRHRWITQAGNRGYAVLLPNNFNLFCGPFTEQHEGKQKELTWRQVGFKDGLKAAGSCRDSYQTIPCTQEHEKKSYHCTLYSRPPVAKPGIVDPSWATESGSSLP